MPNIKDYTTPTRMIVTDNFDYLLSSNYVFIFRQGGAAQQGGELLPMGINHDKEEKALECKMKNTKATI